MFRFRQRVGWIFKVSALVLTGLLSNLMIKGRHCCQTADQLPRPPKPRARIFSRPHNLTIKRDLNISYQMFVEIVRLVCVYLNMRNSREFA